MWTRHSECVPPLEMSSARCSIRWLTKASEAAARWASSTLTQPEGAHACWGSSWLKCTFTTGRLERLHKEEKTIAE
ncbi:unnamed protein product [Lampetra fluviatilis]